MHKPQRYYLPLTLFSTVGLHAWYTSCSESHTYDGFGHLFSKEEQASVTGIGSLDFGARHYDPFVARWLSPDPLMEKYYGMSPYLYCAGNPVNLVDPDGTDIWGVDKQGDINRIRRSRRTEIRTIDENDNVINKLTINTSDLLSSSIIVNNKQYDYFVTSNDMVAKQVFEFLSSPSNWGFKDNGVDNSIINESAVFYTNIGNSILIGERQAVPTASLALQFIDKGAIFSHIDHVHVNNDPNPSGIGENNGDIGTILFLERNGIRFSTPEDKRYYIFTPNGKMYYSYDKYMTLEIEPAIIKAY